MGTMTPAQRRALYESARFARETTYNGPLGPEYRQTSGPICTIPFAEAG